MLEMLVGLPLVLFVAGLCCLAGRWLQPHDDTSIQMIFGFVLLLGIGTGLLLSYLLGLAVMNVWRSFAA